jgi:cysteine desulfurase / selenocysteine lyase
LYLIVDVPTEVQQPRSFDVQAIRNEFPMLQRRVHGKPLVYLDNAASSLKPAAMITRLSDFYKFEFANTNEQNSLSRAVTAAVQDVRSTTGKMLGASSPEEIIFVRNATEAINVVAHGFARSVLKPGDEVLVTVAEHDSNLLPWQIACEMSGASLRIAPVEPSGELDLHTFENTICDRTRVIAVSHVSNVFGTIYPVQEIGAIGRRLGIPFLVDGAQAAPHLPVDVNAIGCQFYAMSAHKMGGPTGVGVLYGRRDWLEKLPPFQVGGVMDSSLTPTTHSWKPLPKKFEAGTESIAEIVAFGSALTYWQQIGNENVARTERELVQYATDRLQEIKGVKIIGAGSERISVLSFTVDGIEAQDVETALDRDGIIVRGGQLNARLLMQRLELSGAVRASFMFYNTKEDCDTLLERLHRIVMA